MKDNISLSVIIPVHNEEEVIEKTIKQTITTLKEIGINPCITIIDDGSSDNSWGEIKKITSEYKTSVKAIKLSRNFGKDSAIIAGLESKESDLYLVIDADGEHPIEKIKDFYSCYRKSNCDVVHGIKENRRGGKTSRTYSKLFNIIFNSLTNIDLKQSSDYKLFNKKFRNALLSYGDYDYFYRAAAQDVGFQAETVYFDEKERVVGKTSWGNIKLAKYALNSIINYSHYPLYLILLMGLISVILGLGLGLKVLIDIFGHNVAPDGYLSLLILSLLSMGMIMSSIGILGIYVSKIFNEVKARPRYIISESI